MHITFRDGCFSVQMSSNNPSRWLLVDQAFEVTVNRHSNTRRHNQIQAEVRGNQALLHNVWAQLRDIVHENKADPVHYDLRQPRTAKDEEAVSAVVSLTESWVNPFSSQQDIINISTAKGATPDVASDLLNALDVGDKCYTKLSDTVKLNKLKTFSHLSRKKELKTQTGRAMILKTDRSLFGRIIVMVQSWNLHMADILSYPPGTVPMGTNNPQGLPRKTNKAFLPTALHKNVAPEEEMPLNSVSEIAQTVFTVTMMEWGFGQRTDMVFDKYIDLSIKSSERRLRGEQHGSSPQSIMAKQPVCQWR